MAQEIDLDNILGTGVGSNRQTTPPNNADNNPPNPNTGNTPPAGDPPAGDPAKPNTTPDNNGSNQNQDIDNEEYKDKVLSLFSSFANAEGLSEEQSKVRTSLLSKYKGESFDSQGNVIDKEGNIVKAFEDVFKDEVDTDDTVLDADGNQVDEKGNIVKTNLELAAEKSTVNKLHLESGYTFLDEQGKTKIYPDTYEGVKEFTNDLAVQRFEESKAAFFNQNKELSEVAKHLLAGNSLDTYKASTEYPKDIKSLSKEQKIAYVKDSLKIKNFSDDRIASYVKLLEDSNTIDKEAEMAIKDLKDYDKQVESQRERAYQQQLQENEKKVEQHWNTVNDLITNDKLGVVNIPKEDKEAFFNYLAIAVDDNGNSQSMLDYSNEKLENKLVLDYLRFKKFDLNKLVKQEVQKDKIINLRSLIERSANIQTPSADKNASKKQGKDIDISISSLLG